ncbi:hypothetical protein [Methylomonas rivi]|uniref:Uncharacterized protein n=1 Tax=Methylomonas rivi TaxID=2952226 RepID=A0ABT1U5N5_9GAMM|nr:hypothetical protein [Methylomonas sp. WSC-6]MCQ8129172.1 hypothetical protein [Methylomonas sp. WSC-6]
MNFYIGLILLSGYVNLSWADDFKLTFSQDIIEAAGQQADDLGDLALPPPEKPVNPVPIPAAQEETRQSRMTEAGKTEKQPETLEPGTRPGFRSYSARSQLSEPQNNFLPIQDVSANHFWGLGMSADNASLGNESRHAGEHNQMVNDPFAELHDEMRLLVGEDMYAKMVWTYLDVKQLDNWIYATIKQSELFARDSLIVGINDQLMVGLTSLGLVGSNDRNLAFEEQLAAGNQENGRQINGLNNAEQMINDAVMRAEFERNSSFFGVLKYLTVNNFLYLLLSVLVSVYLVKLVRFLIRQQ